MKQNEHDLLSVLFSDNFPLKKSVYLLIQRLVYFIFISRMPSLAIDKKIKGQKGKNPCLFLPDLLFFMM